MNIKQIGLSTSAFAYNVGTAGKNTERKNPNPWTLEEFIDFVSQHNLGGIEMPLARFVPDLNVNRLDKVHEILSDRGMFFIMDAERALDVEEINRLMPIAKAFNSSIIRIKTSNILSCARKKLGHPWPEHVEYCISTLKKLAPQLREQGLKIAIENHQDLDSHDLLKIVEAVGVDVVGVTFDIGNAFSVCEDPIFFAQKLGSSIINIHLKDYKIFRSTEGFRLARCPLGAGSVDFKAVLPVLARNSPNARMIVELGALEARNIAWLEPNFWEEIWPRADSERAAFTRLLERQIINVSDESWRTPWETGALPIEVALYEVKELETSLDYLSKI